MNATMRVRLLKPHTHAGQSRASGDRIDVAPDTAAWLAGLGVAVAESESTVTRGRRARDPNPVSDAGTPSVHQSENDNG